MFIIELQKADAITGTLTTAAFYDVLGDLTTTGSAFGEGLVNDGGTKLYYVELKEPKIHRIDTAQGAG